MATNVDSCTCTENIPTEDVILPHLKLLRTNFDVETDLLSHLRTKKYLSREKEEEFSAIDDARVIKRARMFWGWVETKPVKVLEEVLTFLTQNDYEACSNIVTTLREELAKAKVEAQLQCDKCRESLETTVKDVDCSSFGETEVKEPFQSEQTQVKQVNNNYISLEDTRMDSSAIVSQGPIMPDQFVIETMEPGVDFTDSAAPDFQMNQQALLEQSVISSDPQNTNLKLENRILLKDLKLGVQPKGCLLVTILSLYNEWPSGLGFDFYIGDYSAQIRCICKQKQLLNSFQKLCNKTIYLPKVPLVIKPMNKGDPPDLDIKHQDEIKLVPSSGPDSGATRCPPQQQRVKQIIGNISRVTALEKVMTCARCKKGEVTDILHYQPPLVFCRLCSTTGKAGTEGYQARISIISSETGELVEIGIFTSHILQLCGVDFQEFDATGEERQIEMMLLSGSQHVDYYTKTMTVRTIKQVN